MAKLVVHIKWFDASIDCGDVLERADFPTVMERECAGLLIHECDTAVTLALDGLLDGGNYRVVLTIPKANIRSMRTFEV